jgi:hypothetical protein
MGLPNIQIQDRTLDDDKSSLPQCTKKSWTAGGSGSLLWAPRLWHDSDGRDRRSKTRGHPYGSPRHQNHDALQPSAQGTGRAYSRSPEHPQVYDTILCVATKFSTLCQPIPGAATSAVHSQVAFFQKLAEVLLESIPTCAGQCNYIADGDASVFTRILEDFHGQFGYGR